ncbi:hypothetical protein Tco_0599412 [Tanacetum coccineum]
MLNNTNNVITVNAAGTNEVNAVGGKTSIELPFDPNMHVLEDDSIFNFSRDDKDDSVEEPKKVIHALKDLSWIEAMLEEPYQFQFTRSLDLVDLPRKKAIGSK